jgi:hypothetical protein
MPQDTQMALVYCVSCACFVRGFNGLNYPKLQPSKNPKYPVKKGTP